MVSKRVMVSHRMRALNSIFQHWGISASNQWNRRGEPCTGAAIDSTCSIDSSDYNPGIKCDCSYDNASTCHITQLYSLCLIFGSSDHCPSDIEAQSDAYTTASKKVYALDVVGVIPDELWNLTFLTNLNLGQNYLTGPLSASIGNLTRMQYLYYVSFVIFSAFGTNNFSGSLPSELGNLVKLEQL
ncbi:putative LRR receptor-like serine/threonine-protein kinase [Vitis vinifera]|uniref:Putative LRR receptor-like serine/threonine-protein kinase n=1 Tax=Vitis vinifera TaxID=29760 RepID=A0A438J0L8_VITVI|nr:putative LRR receptor-like serine/threonine-protein kinase [Vitis vinifera]